MHETCENPDQANRADNVNRMRALLYGEIGDI